MRRNNWDAVQLDQNCPETGKLTYPSRYQAKVALSQAIALGRSERNVYRCNVCQLWHLTSKGGKGSIAADVLMTEERVRAIVRSELALRPSIWQRLRHPLSATSSRSAAAQICSPKLSEEA